MTLPFEADLLPDNQDTDTSAPWRELVDHVLKGGAFERLVGKTADGLPIQPLYQRFTRQSPRAFRRQTGPWAVSQRVDHPDCLAANALALADLEGGANALTLVFDGSTGAHGFGLVAANADSLAQSLQGVELDLIAIRLDSPGQGATQARLLDSLISQRRLVPAMQRIDFGCDPVSAAIRSGAFIQADAPDVANLARHMLDKGYCGTFFMADSRIIHAAGGSEAQELAHVLASALHYLRQLERSGLSLDAARRQIAFLLVADADQFLGIAKFRALRQLWAQVETACGLTPLPIQLHAETAWRMLSRRDPWVNILRSAMAVFAAGIGGADVITSLPFTAALGLPDAFARRIARNSQLVLLEEANLAKVADPAAGAGGYEALTQNLCEAAWAKFQETEQAGGLVGALHSGQIQRQVRDAAAQRARAIAHRKAPLTGTSEFANLSEQPVSVLLGAPAVLDDTALPAMRDAEPFEALRDRADAFAQRRGAPMRVFLANLGPLAAFAPRAQFATNVFAAGGIEAISGESCVQGDGTTDLETLLHAANISKAPLICICGTDAAYASEGARLALRLAAARKNIFLAGRPADDLVAAGVSQFVYTGCNVVALLNAAHDSLAGSQ